MNSGNGAALAGDTQAEEEGFEPPRANARLHHPGLLRQLRSAYPNASNPTPRNTCRSHFPPLAAPALSLCRLSFRGTKGAGEKRGGFSGPEEVDARGHCNRSLLRTCKDLVRNVLIFRAAGGTKKAGEGWAFSGLARGRK